MRGTAAIGELDPDANRDERAAARPSSRDAFRARAYFPALDGLRALSIAAVLLHHIPAVHQAGLQILQRNGRYGVDFFFLISGFLIATLLLREQRTRGRIDLRSFYRRRAMRLFPLYFVLLGVECLLVFGAHAYSPENQHLFREKLPSYLLYVSNWRLDRTQGPFFFSWSLAAEEQFYLSFAVALLVLPGRWIVAGAAAAWAVKAIALGCFSGAWADALPARILFSYQEAILLGVLLAYALENEVACRALHRLVRRPLVPLGSAACLILILSTHELTNKSAPDAQLVLVLMATCMLGCIVRGEVPLISSAPMRHIGKVSYGIYLMHMLAIMAMKRLFPASPLLCLVSSAALVILAASFVHRHFESRFIALGRGAPLQASSASSSASA